VSNLRRVDRYMNIERAISKRFGDLDFTLDIQLNQIERINILTHVKQRASDAVVLEQ